MPEIFLRSLTCHKPEDRRTDECRLDVFTDHDEQPRLRLKKDMSSGSLWQLGPQQLNFNETVTVKLWDEDGRFDADDFLGEVAVTTAAGRHTGEFNLDGARYTLSYEVRGTANPAPPPTPAMSHATVKLLWVRCQDTEDVTGADHFYVVGGASAGGEQRAILTKPIHINDGETKPFPASDQVLYDGPLDPHGTLSFALVAYDEDAAKDWARHEERIKELTDGIEDGIERIPDTDEERVKKAQVILKIAIKALAFVVKRDKDDKLGTFTVDLPVRDLRTGTRFLDWHMEKRTSGWFNWWSTWNYHVAISIEAR